MIKLKGIDISAYQTPSQMNYDLIAKQIDFAILRLGYTGWGSARSLTKDVYFDRHYEELTKRGIPVGVYWYSVASAIGEGKREALKVLELIAGKRIQHGIFWDTEDNYHQRATSKSLLTDVAIEFLETIENAGYFAGYYASTYWERDELEMARLAPYFNWQADYRNVTLTEKDCGMWQYSSSGRLNGYSGNLDMNWAFRDVVAEIAQSGLNHLSDTPAPAPVPVPVPVPVPASGLKYKVGDKVIVNGQLFRDSAGNGGGATLKNKEEVIAIVKAGNAKPYHVGELGWVSEASLADVIAPAPVLGPKFSVGDKVLVNGQLFRDSAGNGAGAVLKNKSLVIKYANYGSAKPYHVGELGWVAEASLSK